ncbi:MAG: ABC transporter substrate-binding protein [Actinobacteria bacterium]|nr:ABC transporter substrate-binding protein [Actinomycetota bacterium]
MRQRLHLGLALLIAASALAVVGASQARSGADTIKIGSITILTGPSATIGVETARGAQFMTTYLNRSGGVLGKKLELISADDANNPQLAAQAAAQLIQRDGVVAIAGPTNSVSGIAIQGLQAQSKIPAVAYQSGAEALTGTGSPWVFRSNTTLNHHFDALVTYFAKTKRAKSFAFIGWNLAAGQSSLAGAQLGVDHSPGTRLVYKTQLPLTTQDFSGAISQAKAANPDVVLVGAPMPFAGVLVKQIRQSGWNVAVGATGDFVTTDFGAFLGSAANGLIMTDTGHAVCAKKRKVGAKFVAAWTRAFHREPNANELVGADAVGIIVQAIAHAKSTDGQKIADAIHSLGYNGVRFYATWDKKGNLRHTPIPAVVWAKDGTKLSALTCDIQPIVRKKK